MPQITSAGSPAAQAGERPDLPLYRFYVGQYGRLRPNAEMVRAAAAVFKVSEHEAYTGLWDVFEAARDRDAPPVSLIGYESVYRPHPVELVHADGGRWRTTYPIRPHHRNLPHDKTASAREPHRAAPLAEEARFGSAPTTARKTPQSEDRATPPPLDVDLQAAARLAASMDRALSCVETLARLLGIDLTTPGASANPAGEA